MHHLGNGEFEAGTLRKLREGQPITSRLVTIEGDGDWRKMHTVHGARKEKAEATPPPSKGPAMVNSATFRDNWTNIFGGKTRGQA